MPPQSRRGPGFAVSSLAPAKMPGVPEGVLRLDYHSGGIDDWALIWPPDGRQRTWFVVIHGHGSAGDQLYTRPDIRTMWLPEFRRGGAGILTPNLRGNAWMCPEAADDLHALLGLARERYGAERFILASGSMGGTSNLLYGVQQPGDVAGIVALCPAGDLASYYAWCRHRDEGVWKEIADAIRVAYKGEPAQAARRYAQCSALHNARRLTMPTFVAHGTGDDVIPIAQSRRLVGALAEAPGLAYVEMPGGHHDSPLALAAQGVAWVLSRIPGQG
jgi:pimeloyl-ACP methyl ester carboxylesterase